MEKKNYNQKTLIKTDGDPTFITSQSTLQLNKKDNSPK